MFWAAREIFGLAFAQVTNMETCHPVVRVREVTDKASGKHLGLWNFDPYARPGKHSGAWINAYRNQERFEHWVSTPEVLNRFALNYNGQTGTQGAGRQERKNVHVQSRFATVEYVSAALVDMKLRLGGGRGYRSRRVRATNADGPRHA